MNTVPLICHKQFVHMLRTVHICILSKNRHYMPQQ